MQQLYKTWVNKKSNLSVLQQCFEILLRLIALLIFPFIYIALLCYSFLIRKIRFIFLYRERFGHLIDNTDYWLRRRDTINEDFLYIGFCYKPCNNAVVNIFSRHFYIIKNQTLCKLLSPFGVFKNQFRQEIPSLPTEGIRFEVCTKVTLTEDEKRRGEDLIGALFGFQQRWYVLFHARDSLFDRTIQSRDVNYAAMLSYRNMNIEDMEEAMNFVSEVGGGVIRCGFPVEKAFSTGIKNYIDYSTSVYRTELNDIYLFSSARFLVCAANGAISGAALFDTPIVVVNQVPLGHWICARNVIFIPKNLTDTHDNILPFSEQLRYFRKYDLSASMHGSEDLRRSGLRLVDNTPTQIREAVVEMFLRLEGRWVSPEGYDEKYNKLLSLYKVYGGYGAPKSRLAWSFIRDTPVF